MLHLTVSYRRKFGINGKNACKICGLSSASLRARQQEQIFKWDYGVGNGEGNMLSDNSNRYDETMTYDNNGNVTKLHRCGKMQKGTYGNVDELTTMEYSGNQLTARHYHYQRDVVASRDVVQPPSLPPFPGGQKHPR